MFLPKSTSHPLQFPSLEMRKRQSCPSVQLSLGVCPPCFSPHFHLEAKCSIPSPNSEHCCSRGCGQRSLQSRSDLKGTPYYLLPEDMLSDFRKSEFYRCSPLLKTLCPTLCRPYLSEERGQSLSSVVMGRVDPDYADEIDQLRELTRDVLRVYVSQFLVRLLQE